MFQPFDAILFDIDGTLVNLFPAHNRSYRDAFHKVTKIFIKNPGFFSGLHQLGAENAVWEKAWEFQAHNPYRLSQDSASAEDMGY